MNKNQLNELERLYEQRGELQWYIDKFKDQIEEHEEKIRRIDGEISRLRPQAIVPTESTQA